MGSARQDILDMLREARDAFGREVQLVRREASGTNPNTLKPILIEAEAVTVTAIRQQDQRRPLGKAKGSGVTRVYTVLAEDWPGADTQYDVLKDGAEEFEIGSIENSRADGGAYDVTCGSV